jgi:hypothetical protein
MRVKHEADICSPCACLTSYLCVINYRITNDYCIQPDKICKFCHIYRRCAIGFLSECTHSRLSWLGRWTYINKSSSNSTMVILDDNLRANFNPWSMWEYLLCPKTVWDTVWVKFPGHSRQTWLVAIWCFNIFLKSNAMARRHMTTMASIARWFIVKTWCEWSYE